MLEKFCDKVNSKIEKVEARKMAISKDFEKWKEENEQRISWVSKEEDDDHDHDNLKLKHQKLEIGSSYKPFRDAHAYLTNNYLWGSVLTAGACVGGGR